MQGTRGVSTLGDRRRLLHGGTRGRIGLAVLLERRRPLPGFPSLRRVIAASLLVLGVTLPTWAGQLADPTLHSEFHVKYVAAGAVYLDRGKSAGLDQGMKLQVKHSSPSAPRSVTSTASVIAEIRVVSVAQTSAVCEVISQKENMKAGDLAYLEEKDIEKAEQAKTMGNTRKYPQVVSFDEGDALEEEARAFVPRPPLPEVNRARGMVGFEYGGIQSGGPFASNTTQLGLFLKTDITRIDGTYWNLRGYWRGEMNTTGGSAAPQTLQTLINRTYHLQMTYDNPNSPWVMGVGRLYLPWAASLDTIDGGYFGRRVEPGVIVGMFAGSTPDPTSWNYSPNRHLGGGFVNFSGGDFKSWRYSSTEGAGDETVGWSAQRPFVFTENNISYGNVFSIYHSLQADSPQIPNSNGKSYTGLSRSFLTVRITPIPRLELDFNHNYFRDIPTFDFALISTGLVDQLLFQGLSVGARLEVTKNIALSTTVGRNSGTGDARSSLNQMYGITVNRIWRTGVRGDLRWSKFDSSFGNGTYSSLSLTRNFGEILQTEFLLGDQRFRSSLSSDTSYRSAGGSVYWFPPKVPVYLDAGFTREQGVLNYNQWYTGLGYRFDTYRKRREVKK